MMAEQYENNAQTTLNGAINNSVTSITVTDGSVFPSTGDFRLKIDTELLLCTARTGNTLTVTRAAESTTAASHLDLAPVKLVLTKASFLNLLSEGVQVGARASRPASLKTGGLYIPNDYGLPSRYNGSSWDAIHLGLGRVVTPPVIANFTWDSQGNALADDRDGVVMTKTYGSTSHSMLYQTPGSTYTLRCSFNLIARGYTFFGAGLFIKDSVTGKIITYSHRAEGRLQIDYWTDATTFLSTHSGTDIQWRYGPAIHMKIQKTGSNRLYSWSVNGYDWVEVADATAHTAHLSGEDRVGIGMWALPSAGTTAVIGAQAHFFDYSLT
jgi:hypothetical protein